MIKYWAVRTNLSSNPELSFLNIRTLLRVHNQLQQERLQYQSSIPCIVSEVTITINKQVGSSKSDQNQKKTEDQNIKILQTGPDRTEPNYNNSVRFAF